MAEIIIIVKIHLVYVYEILSRQGPHNTTTFNYYKTRMLSGNLQLLILD